MLRTCSCWVTSSIRVLLNSQKKKREKIFREARDDVVDYCERKGWTVEFGVSDSEADPEKKAITIATQSEEFAFYTLLHEVGHMHNAEDLEDYEERYPGLSLAKSNVKYKVSYVEEEFDAWRSGMELAQDLNLDTIIDLKRWHLLRARCLHSYMRWAINPKGKRVS